MKQKIIIEFTENENGKLAQDLEKIMLKEKMSGLNLGYIDDKIENL